MDISSLISSKSVKVINSNLPIISHEAFNETIIGAKESFLSIFEDIGSANAEHSVLDFFALERLISDLYALCGAISEKTNWCCSCVIWKKLILIFVTPNNLWYVCLKLSWSRNIAFVSSLTSLTDVQLLPGYHINLAWGTQSYVICNSVTPRLRKRRYTVQRTEFVIRNFIC